MSADRRWVILGRTLERKRMDLVWELRRDWMAVAESSMLSSLVVRNCWMKLSLPTGCPKKRVPVVISASEG